MTQNIPNESLPRINNPAKTVDFLGHFHGDNPARFQVGDLITFKKADGWTWPIMILGIDGEDVDAMFYDGMPHRFRCAMEDLAALRVIRIEEVDEETVSMYRRLVGLDPDLEDDEREDETDHDLNEPYAGCAKDYSEEAA